MITVDNFEIDAAIREDLVLDSEVTPFPVEKGADNADHIRHLPSEVTLDCIVSNTPFGPMQLVRVDPFLDPAEDAYTKLKEIRANREPVVIETGFETYRDMVLKSLSIPRASSDGSCLRFTATFVKFQFVENERTSLNVALPRAKKKVDLGQKASPYAVTFGTFGSGF